MDQEISCDGAFVDPNWNWMLHRTFMKHQAAVTLLRLPTDAEDKTDLNDALPVLTILPADEAQKAEKDDEN